MQFSFPRFFNLFTKQWSENKKLYFLSIIALPVILATLTLLFPITDSRLTSEVQNMIFSFGLFIIGSIFTSSLLSVYAPKATSIRNLMLPVSPLEKLLVAIVYGIIIFPLVYFALGYPTMQLVHKIDTEGFGNLNKSLSLNTRNIKIMLCIFLMAQSFVLHCSLYFKKFIFLKVFLSFAIIILVFNTLNGLMIKSIYSNEQPTEFSALYKKKTGLSDATLKKSNFESDADNGTLFSDLVFKNKYADNNKIRVDDKDSWIPASLCIIIFTLLLVATLFKLKETQL
ncbi:hypothetical protein [Pedobacter nototheniae]|uniref:hypothetical protein n=1 Tax=Pedobacter nototheniae TaxID=2488994 RepID=UPI00292F217A|nr:hypothetical protein [Pedobacter nototheniae]